MLFRYQGKPVWSVMWEGGGRLGTGPNCFPHPPGNRNLCVPPRPMRTQFTDLDSDLPQPLILLLQTLVPKLFVPPVLSPWFTYPTPINCVSLSPTFHPELFQASLPLGHPVVEKAPEQTGVPQIPLHGHQRLHTDLISHSTRNF